MDIKKKRPQLNNEQQAAAFCAENAVVAAGAGSGKTMVLANRFAWLLTEKGYNVDEILTLTFTKKAAAQMFRRIHSLLTEIAEGKGENDLKAARARKALENFVHARIQTHDSYCSSIVKQYAPRYGISPDFSIDEERCRQIAVDISLPFLITHRHNPAIERFYSDHRPNDIAGNIFADVLFEHCRIDKPRDFLADVKTQYDIVCSEWEKQSGNLINMLNETENLILENNAMLPDLVPLLEKNKNITFPAKKDIQEYFDFLLSLPVESCVEKSESHPIQNQMITVLRFLSEICALSLNKGKRSDNTVKENIKELRAIFGRFSSLAVSCMQAGLIISVMSLLDKLQELYIERKRSEGVLTFNDVANLSRTILLEQRDIRQSEKESFKAVMIDEFQDNNDLQKDLLFLLAEKQEVLNNGIPPARDLTPGKLFFVGDEKQSIYFFRGADVSVFRRLKDELKSTDLPLKVNYRSAPALIGAFNAIFGGSDFDPEGKAPLAVAPSVFAPSSEENPLPLYEAMYTPLTAGAEGDGKLSICILNKSRDESDASGGEDARLHADENEAVFIARKIHQLVNGQNYRPSDIAVLFRSRSAQHYFEKHLRLLNIPYACEDIYNFFYGGPVNDIMSVLRLAAHPLDSASYAEMLRSPFAGLSLAGTTVCLSVFNNAENPAVFDDEPLNLLDEKDRGKYLYGQKLFSSIREKSASESISSLVTELWYKEGYRYETEWNPLTNSYRELYDYLFYLAVMADDRNEGLASFTDSMRKLRNSGGQLKEINIPLERHNAVHLMTIHKSKGLEFPVVFICGCGRTGQSERSEDVFFSEDSGVVLSPPLPDECKLIKDMRKNFLWEQLIAEKKLKKTAELRRLLYVGMTRAEKELYLTGSLEIDEPEDSGDLSGAINNYIEEKRKKNENSIPGDSILNNDTFFGLFLPSVASGMSQGFFNFEEIPVYTEEDVKKQETNPKPLTKKHLPNDRESLSEYIKQVEHIYKKAKKITTPEARNNHITPVSLKDNADDLPQTETLGRGFIISREFSGGKADDVFEKVDSLLAKFSKTEGEAYGKFNSGSFGTIAHICVDALLSGKEPVFPPQLSGSISPAEFDAFFAAGKELAGRFVLSPLGKIAQGAKLRENEFSFRSFLKNNEGKEVFINGTIDLFFEDSSVFHVVDFKTDTRETPVEHTAQMACYYLAVSALFAVPAKKECRAWLYYLRTGHAVEMTDKVKQFNLENKAFI
jgi:ATP-dependent exoDNAse (exonuclease V) beta subunit